MFHHCIIEDVYPTIGIYGVDANMEVLKEKLNEYQGEGWRMFAFMKKVIADNNFDFSKAMSKVYNK